MKWTDIGCATRLDIDPILTYKMHPKAPGSLVIRTVTQTRVLAGAKHFATTILGVCDVKNTLKTLAF